MTIASGCLLSATFSPSLLSPPALPPVSASYPSYECLGWYSSGSKIDPEDFETHKMVSEERQRAAAAALCEGCD
jgi:hypothetical protein